jgi:hypothetical protein
MTVFSGDDTEILDFIIQRDLRNVKTMCDVTTDPVSAPHNCGKSHSIGIPGKPLAYQLCLAHFLYFDLPALRNIASTKGLFTHRQDFKTVQFHKLKATDVNCSRI